MRQLLGALAAAVSLFAAAGAAAVPSAEMRDAVARVVVVPEARPDVKVEVVKTDPRLPLRVWRFAGRTHITGALARRIRACGVIGGQPSVFVTGLGVIPYAAMPQVVIHTPMTARVFVAGAVWGAIGRSDGLEFSNAGCGGWIIADVRGRMRLSLAGAGGARTGRAGSAELYSAGTGAIVTGDVAAGVIAMSAGSGAIEVARIDGPFMARVAGVGSVRAPAGQVSAMEATVAGAGDVTLGGVAKSLKASIIGSGDVRVARVTGAVTKAVIGAGKVKIGS